MATNVLRKSSWALLVVLSSGLARLGAAEHVLHNFAAFPRGENPYSGVIRDPAGNFYGTTYAGGAASAGVVYKLNPAGVETVLYNFKGGADGANPYAGVILDSAGNLYGTTFSGGAAGLGVVYKVQAGGVETVLYSFQGGTDGANPYAGVILDDAGNLYGTTYSGGSANAGVVYRLNAAGQEKLLYSFSGGADGANPYAGVILDDLGNLYGTTYSGGLPTGGFSRGGGVVYELDTAGNETVLHSFKGGPTSGKQPVSGVIRDADHNLYGTTTLGGNGDAGVLYKLGADGFTLLYSFSGDGGETNGGVIRDAAGNFYGATNLGRTEEGQVYMVTAAGAGSILYSFTGGADGGTPYASLTLDADGNLYGTTYYGGVGNAGVVFELNTAGQETVLCSFPAGPDGGNPDAGLVTDAAGNLYGTTYAGGDEGLGSVYKLSATGQETVLYSFTGGNDGANPYSAVTLDAAGNLYGTTLYGGGENFGTVFQLNAAGQETVLYRFTGGQSGSGPYGGLTLDASGNLYGTTSYRGAPDEGAVFKLTKAGVLTVLHDFSTDADGEDPQAGVILGPSGSVYGTTVNGGRYGVGTVYKVDSAGQETVLYNFRGGADGANPHSGLTPDAAGNVFGTTVIGGSSGAGVVYKIDAAGHESVLYTFTGGADGGNPYAGVVRDSAGNLYGTTVNGGSADAGVVFEIDAAGAYTVLYSFTGAADGKNPYGNLLIRNGSLYGTTEYGGTRGEGVVFEITTP